MYDFHRAFGQHAGQTEVSNCVLHCVPQVERFRIEDIAIKTFAIHI
jgi:hypothetical protein